MAAILGILFPVFAVILCGLAAARFRVLGGASAEALNRFVYYFALPPLLFTLTAEARLAEILNWPFILAYLGGSLATLIVALAGGYFVRHERWISISGERLSGWRTCRRAATALIRSRQ